MVASQGSVSMGTEGFHRRRVEHEINPKRLLRVEGTEGAEQGDE
jgi:hypothetical protein